jgi:SAM-dependent methyltransferase
MAFDRHYAGCYDLFYGSKDYRSECDMIESIFRRRGSAPNTVADLGCGTARHAIILAERGYAVTGVDGSAEMLRLAEQRVNESGYQIQLIHQELQDLDLDLRFDAAVSMFAVIGYLWDNEGLMSALTSIHSHLTSDGVFIFDCWYGPAVVAHGPQQRFQRFTSPDHEEIIRLVTPDPDGARQIVDVEYETLIIRGEQVVSRSTEKHRMRYFHPMELRLALKSAGFHDIEIGAFSEPERKPTEDDWNVVVSASR